MVWNLDLGKKRQNKIEKNMLKPQGVSFFLLQPIGEQKESFLSWSESEFNYKSLKYEKIRN